MGEASDFGNEALHPLPVFSTDEAPAGSEFALSIKFRMGSEGDDEMMHVAGRLTATAFGDVRWNGHGGFSQLVRQSQVLAGREDLGEVPAP